MQDLIKEFTAQKRFAIIDATNNTEKFRVWYLSKGELTDQYGHNEPSI
jgi:hypothetical protein